MRRRKHQHIGPGCSRGASLSTVCLGPAATAHLLRGSEGFPAAAGSGPMVSRLPNLLHGSMVPNHQGDNAARIYPAGKMPASSTYTLFCARSTSRLCGVLESGTKQRRRRTPPQEFSQTRGTGCCWRQQWEGPFATERGPGPEPRPLHYRYDAELVGLLVIAGCS